MTGAPGQQRVLVAVRHKHPGAPAFIGSFVRWARRYLLQDKERVEI